MLQKNYFILDHQLKKISKLFFNLALWDETILGPLSTWMSHGTRGSHFFQQEQEERMQHRKYHWKKSIITISIHQSWTVKGSHFTPFPFPPAPSQQKCFFFFICAKHAQWGKSYPFLGVFKLFEDNFTLFTLVEIKIINNKNIQCLW